MEAQRDFTHGGLIPAREHGDSEVPTEGQLEQNFRELVNQGEMQERDKKTVLARRKVCCYCTDEKINWTHSLATCTEFRQDKGRKPDSLELELDLANTRALSARLSFLTRHSDLSDQGKEGRAVPLATMVAECGFYFLHIMPRERFGQAIVAFLTLPKKRRFYYDPADGKVRAFIGHS